MSEDEKSILANKLGKFYHSAYVAKNQPWILLIPYEEWLQRQFRRIGEVA